MTTLPGILDSDRIVKLEQRVAELERSLADMAILVSQGFATSGADGAPPPVATRGEPLMAEERYSASIRTRTNGTTADGRPYRLPTKQALDELTATVEPDEYMCVNCVTPWKCNGPHHEESCPTNRGVGYCHCDEPSPFDVDDATRMRLAASESEFHIGQRVVVYTGGYPVCKPGTVASRVGEKWRVELDKASGVTVGEDDMVAIPSGWR